MIKKFLIDKIWLEKQYITNNRSALQIADLLGCSRYLIYKKLRKFDIRIRTLSEAQKNIGSDFSLLNNKVWLINEYINKKRTCKSIAIEVGINSGKEGTVTKALHRFGIKTRTKLETRLLNRDDCGFFENKEFIDGSLLGDGGLEVVTSKNRCESARFSKKSKSYMYLVWNSQFMFKKECKSRISYEKAKLKDKIFNSYRMRSLFHRELKVYLDKWYQGVPPIKVVPKDVGLTPFSILIWFLDDGYSCRLKKEVRVFFSSMCFTKDAQQFLCNELMRLYKIKASLNRVKSGTGYLIRIHKQSVPVFYKIIGPCPEPLKEVFGYKWK